MPKQFIDVLGCGRTLLQLTVDRFQDICPSENIWVVTSVDYADVVKEQLPSIPVDHILLEPCRRNTAPCIAYVSWKIKAKNPKANIVVTPSDHVVMDVREFARVINSAMKFTADSDAIVTFGNEGKPSGNGIWLYRSGLCRWHVLPIRKFIELMLLRKNRIWKLHVATFSGKIIFGMQGFLYGMSIR